MNVSITVNGEQVSREIEPRQLLVHFIRETPGLTGHPLGLRHLELRRLRGADGRRAGQVLHDPGGDVRGPRDPHGRVARGRRPARPDPGGLPRDARAAVRVLHAGDADDRSRAPGREPGSDRAGDPHRDLGRHLPLHGLQEHRRAVRWAAEHEAPRNRGSEHGHGREPAQRADRAPDRLRSPEAQGGRALHPRQGHLPRRHPAAGDGPRGDPAQPVRARTHRLDRHLDGARAPERRRRRHREGPRDARAGVDADDLLRHAGRARGRQGPLPGPGDRVRDRDRRVLGERRARS